jgi:hypothetical protein
MIRANTGLETFERSTSIERSPASKFSDGSIGLHLSISTLLQWDDEIILYNVDKNNGLNIKMF